MYLISESLFLIQKKNLLRQFDLTTIQLSVLTTYQTSIGHDIKYISVWLTVLMVLSLRIGTIVLETNCSKY